MPASRITVPIRRCVAGHVSEALNTTVLPQASGTAIARTPKMIGAFQGAIPSTTPAGCRTAIAIFPGTSEGITSPLICVVIAAASRSILAAKCTLKGPQPSVEPSSSIIRAENSSPRSSSNSAARSNLFRRSLGPICDHPGKAPAAASTAASA